MLVRTGIVSDINYKNGTVKVVFPGADDYQSQELQVIHRRTKKDKSWNMPCIDEVVIVIFDGTSEGDVGYVLGSVYDEGTAPPNSDNRFKYIAEDGTYIEYDRELKQASLYCVGDIVATSDKNIKATAKENVDAMCKNFNCVAESQVNITAPVINLNGVVNTSAVVNVADDVITSKGSVNGHNHSYNWAHDPGASTTAPMNE